MKVPQYLIIALLATSLFSCKKDDSNKECTLNEANLVGTYKIGAAKYKLTASSPEIDYMPEIDNCELDDTQTFKSDHTFIYTDAGVKCDGSEDETGTWSLSGNTLNAGGETGTISSFNCSGFTITESNVLQDGDQIIITFKKQ